MVALSPLPSTRPSTALSADEARQQAVWLQTLAATDPGSDAVSALEQQAFEALYNFYAPRLKSYLVKQGAGVQADDLVQDSMIKVWQQAARYDATKASVGTWIYTIARNTWVDAWRREDYPDLAVVDDAALASLTPPTPADQVSLAETIRAVQQALAALPLAQQQTVTRAFYENESHAKIAAITGAPLGTVKARLRLAFKQMRAMLGKEEGAI